MVHTPQQAPSSAAMAAEMCLKCLSMVDTTLAESSAIGTCVQSVFSVTTSTNSKSSSEIHMHTWDLGHQLDVIGAETASILTSHSSDALNAHTMYARIVFQGSTVMNNNDQLKMQTPHAVVAMERSG